LVFVYAFSLLNLWFYFDVAAMVRTFDRTRPFVVAFLVALSKGERLCQLFFILRAILLVNLVLNVSLVSALTLDLVVWIALFLSSSVYRDLGIFPEFLAVWPPVMVQAGRASAGLLLLGVLGYGAKTYADHLRDVEQHRMQKDLEQTKQANKEALARQRHQDALEQDNNRHRNAMELEEAKRKPVSAQPQPQGPVPPPGLGSRSPWWAPTSGPKNPFKP
jgi:hypothetical protein